MKRILVVDDMAICREPIAEALQGHGYDVVCAASGEEALGTLQERQPDVVLLDMTMPGLDGLAVLRTIRRNPEWRSLPVIMLTDKADRECIVGAASLNIQGYVLKSNFSLTALLTRIEACFAQPVAAIACSSPKEPSQDARGRRENARNNDRSVGPTTAVATSVAEPPSPGKTQPHRTAKPENEQAASLGDLKPVITKDALIRLVKKGLELRPLGAAVHNVMAATSTAGCSAEDVGKAVSQDQALSIRVLKLANSSAYSRGRPVDSVKEAVQRIGTHEVRRMVMALGVVQQYEEAAVKYLDPRLFWEHSTACGLVAVAVARTRQAKNPDEYFLWGTLHDIGRLILFEHVPDAYSRVWEVAERLDLPLEAVESKLMLLDHCEILESALEHWQFPKEFIPPVINHHRSMAAIRRLGAQFSEPAAIIALADRLAHALLLGSSGNDVVYPLEELAEFLSLTPKTLAEIADKVVEETRDLKFSMLARAHETAWPDFAMQIKERIGVPLRPLYLGPNSAVDAFRMFVDRVAGAAGDGTPNVAIVHLRKADELSQWIAKLEAEERKLAVSNTPLLMITTDQDIQPHQALLRSRRCVILRTPMRIATFVGSITELLGEAPP